MSSGVSVKKTIGNINEITGQNHSEDELNSMLKECSTDPNETALKLLLLGEWFNLIAQPICLMKFGPNTEINCLSCGHIFHKSCLEKWLKYWNTTCPLCRDYMIPQDMEEYECLIDGSALLVLEFYASDCQTDASICSPQIIMLQLTSMSLEPTEMLVWERPPSFLWRRHLKEPACVVGEHKQLYLVLTDFLRAIGEVGSEDEERQWFFFLT